MRPGAGVDPEAFAADVRAGRCDVFGERLTDEPLEAEQPYAISHDGVNWEDAVQIRMAQAIRHLEIGDVLAIDRSVLGMPKGAIRKGMAVVKEITRDGEGLVVEAKAAPFDAKNLRWGKYASIPVRPSTIYGVLVTLRVPAMYLPGYPSLDLDSVQRATLFGDGSEVDHIGGENRRRKVIAKTRKAAAS
ncbi:MAG: hypothetical protein AAGJ54_05740 [Planctomycetota bacterium]